MEMVSNKKKKKEDSHVDVKGTARSGYQGHNFY